MAFMLGALPVSGAWYATRQSFTGKIMDMVEKRCVDLEKEVAACRERDTITGARIYFLEGSLAMALPELARLEPKNVVLTQVIGALNALPEDMPKTMSQLLTRLDEMTRGLSWNGKEYVEGGGKNEDAA